jgi:hypothetical protein
MWLTPQLRLGPPSKQYDAALLGPRVVIVDAIVSGVDRHDAILEFPLLARQVAAFLTILLRREVKVSSLSALAWTWSVDESGQAETAVRQLGYVESEMPREMPRPGSAHEVPLVVVQRPDISRFSGGIGASDTEQQLPSTPLISGLVNELTQDRRRQFWQVATMLTLAYSLGYENQTAAFSWLVAACEALKPPGRAYQRHNIHDVVAVLLDNQTANLLKEDWFQAQAVRSDHLHTGAFRGSEFTHRGLVASFRDPSFDQAHDNLWFIAPAALIEWLKRGGVVVLPPIKQRIRWRSVRISLIYLICGICLGYMVSKMI